MPFTSKTLLAARIDEAHINVLSGLNDSALNQAIAETDALITSYTGIVPVTQADNNHKLLTSIAGDIVIGILSGRQTDINDIELKRRQDAYDNAMKLLIQIRNGDIELSTPAPLATPTTPEFHAAPRRTTDI